MFRKWKKRGEPKTHPAFTSEASGRHYRRQKPQCLSECSECQHASSCIRATYRSNYVPRYYYTPRLRPGANSLPSAWVFPCITDVVFGYSEAT
ncbi:hypothetical protein CBM2615_B60097 [Cupriavidus taiwanensis]|uniref:Uncharacterized protein n=1 Tax=Cupriavidus taiwanensis TaxID=164546 RepID=A0A976B356_9BURK|nr:hypothetical protein CBM2614_B50090 [Cupriavidus taiwanensis]SOZ69764.1 hypothetical protein CBM2615_B60097 [Cupriavidus taiwanensis]SOZ72946.1 hypothetical protein CBM2613_B50094 [Cupriavidus taiwanensis]SPA09854.1 hypothetical protein CBM2625_B60010 [Cupriavidus taiwanensis]